ncbi:Uncharacterised protein [uncultured archaeon]|nr:Uncharacterised protein [uncultured archaeon]
MVDKNEASNYLGALRNSKMKDVKIVMPQKRGIVDAQRNRCYVCQKTLSAGICHFEEIEGPDPKSGANSRALRAVCSPCYFDIKTGKKPVIKSAQPEPKKEVETKDDDFEWDFD